MPTRRSNDRASSPEMLTFGVTDDTGHSPPSTTAR